MEVGFREKGDSEQKKLVFQELPLKFQQARKKTGNYEREKLWWKSGRAILGIPRLAAP